MSCAELIPPSAYNQAYMDPALNVISIQRTKNEAEKTIVELPHKLANEWACCSRKNASYITMQFVMWREWQTVMRYARMSLG